MNAQPLTRSTAHQEEEMKPVKRVLHPSLVPPVFPEWVTCPGGSDKGTPALEIAKTSPTPRCDMVMAAEGSQLPPVPTRRTVRERLAGSSSS